MPKRLNRIKFLADECVGLPTIALLRESGYPVATAPEVNLCGKSDLEILNWAIKNKRVLITEDIDFGNITLYPPKLHQGIIILRFRHSQETEINSVLSKLLKELKPKDFKKALIIVDSDKYRLRKE